MEKLIRKSFVDRCNKFGKDVDNTVEKSIELITEYYIEEEWDDSLDEEHFDRVCRYFNATGGWDVPGSLLRTLSGIEQTLHYIEPEDEFKRLHGEYYDTLE